VLKKLGEAETEETTGYDRDEEQRLTARVVGSELEAAGFAVSSRFFSEVSARAEPGPRA